MLIDHYQKLQWENLEMYEQYWDAVGEQWNNILGLYKRFEDKKPVILLDIQEQKIYAYPYNDFKSELSKKSQIQLEEQYETAILDNEMVVFVRNNEKKDLVSYSLEYHENDWNLRGETMNDKPIFVIGEQHAGRDIFNIARDLNINQNSPAEDILKLIEAIQHKVGELDITEKDKKRIVNQIEGAKIELEDEKPDKKLIAENITKTTEILKEAKTTGETLKDIGVLVAKAAAWLGTTAAKLGWIF